MKLLQAKGQPEVFIIINDIKHWLQNKVTYDYYGKVYGFEWNAWERISLEGLNEYETGATYNEDPNVPTLPTRSIYNPLPEPAKKLWYCRAYLNHSQIIPPKVRTKIELDTPSYDPDGMFDAKRHVMKIQEDRIYLLIGTVWFDKGAVPGGVYSAIVAKNDKPLSKDCLIERDDMCPAGSSRDIQPGAPDGWPLKKGDEISLWAIYYFGGPCELKTAHTQNFLTIISQ